MGIDYQSLAKGFKVGDVVHRYFPAFDAAMSPFVGRVVAVHKGIGFLDVQWPYGVDRVSSDELVLCNPDLLRFLPPSLDQSSNTLEVIKAKNASSIQVWRTTGVPPEFHRDLAFLWGSKTSEIGAYDVLWRKYSSTVSDTILRDETQKFYLFSKNLPEVYLQKHLQTKQAAYWVAQGRQYRVTQEELKERKPLCPRCGTRMRRTIYKIRKGDRMRLFACPKDLFLVKIEDLLAPDGGPVSWLWLSQNTAPQYPQK